eukprot:m51a1_g14017 hypothetical protein (548) ;mRNA; f:1101514-1103389
MLSTAFVLALLPAAALCSLFVQYNSASDTSLAMRVVIIGTCRDLYATPRLFSDAQFLFREVPALDGKGGVSLIPGGTNGYYICDDGTGAGRLVAVKPALSAALCSFKKVPGLSNPSLVSFEQDGKYIGYAKAYDYDCSAWFSGKAGWTIGLVEKPTTLTLATWVSTPSPSVTVYIQGTNYWLGNCRGNAFFTSSAGDITWDVVPALSNASSTTLASLRLSSNKSLYLGIDSAGAQQLQNTSAPYVPVRVWNCAGRESDCSWNLVESTTASGDFNLVIPGSTRTLDRQAANVTLVCPGENDGGANMYFGSAATLGFLRVNYVTPNMPPVIVNSSSSSSVSPPKCADFTLCRTCITTELSCGWCAETGVCSKGTASSPSNCSASKWFFDSCVAATHNDGGSTNLIAPLVGGIVGGVAVLSAILVAAVLVVRSFNRREPAVLNVPVEGASIDFIATAASRDLSDTTSPVTIQYSGSGMATALGHSSGSGSALGIPLEIPPTYDMNMSLSLAPVSPGNPSMEFPAFPSFAAAGGISPSINPSLASQPPASQ